MTRRTRKRLAGGLALTGASAAAAYIAFRPRLLNWGATPAEMAAVLPGDDRVNDPPYVSTRAITIQARPEHVWPWLVQMGYRRGGLYSYDWLDRLFGYLDRPSAEEVLPEFQALRVGDRIPLGRGPSWPVAELVPQRALVIEPLAGVVTWAFSLIPLAEHATRLVTRVRMRLEPSLSSRLAMTVMDPAAFVMTRKMLLGIRRRAEALNLRASSSRPRPFARP